jgi:UDP-N-acetylglucosamine 2-epimerase (non-hydrolysing)
MRTIGVVTVGRSDYGLLRPILRRIQDDRTLNLALFVGGMHCYPNSAATVSQIEADKFPIAARVDALPRGDAPADIAKAMGEGVSGFAHCFARIRPDILLVLGDRFEMHAAALAALPFKIPVAHVHGGEITEGAFDDALRHSITKLSHLHFASAERYAQRLIQMGEEPWRVIVSGAPGLDDIQAMTLLEPKEIERQFGLTMSPPPLLVTFHPVTLEYEQTESQTRHLLDAIALAGIPPVFTLPNADTNNGTIIRLVREFVRTNASARIVENFGTRAYFSMMALCAAMVGNSSSGIIEAASFNLPVVNVGTRQKGRIRGANVIDVGYETQDVLRGIRAAADPEFRASLNGLKNPYGAGNASAVILDRLKSVPLDEKLVKKSFHDIESSNG